MESNHQPADYKSAALPLSHTSILSDLLTILMITQSVINVKPLSMILPNSTLGGGRGWIRTIEDEVDGFTVRCIWPLCNPSMTHLNKQVWWLEPESNQWHKDFQSFALPTELSSLIKFGDPEGARTLDLQRDRLAL